MHEFSDLRNELLLETSKLLSETLQRRGPVLLRFPWAKTSRRKVVSFCNNLRRIFSVGIRHHLEKNLAMKKLKKEDEEEPLVSAILISLRAGDLAVCFISVQRRLRMTKTAAESRKQGRARTLPLAR